MTTVTNKNGIEFDIDAIATDLNNKVDLDGTNATYPHIVSRIANSQGGIVEIWSDGYCVQTGTSTKTTNQTISFTQSYKDTDYKVYLSGVNYTSSASDYGIVKTKKTDSIIIVGTTAIAYDWRTEGYIR